MGDRLAVFGRVPLPTVSTEEPADITATSVTLSHTEPAAGQDVESCLFEYGTDLTYDLGEVPCSPGGSLSAGTDVTAIVEGLTPLHSYHYRLAATGENGITRYGADMTFTATDGTAPAVTGTAASVGGPSAATLEATIDSMGAPTVYRFEYGTSSSYGTQTKVSDPISADVHDHQALVEIAALQPGTTYHFRAVATSFNGTTAGPDRTFTTPDRPVIESSGVSAVTPSTADLSASIRPRFSPTGYRLEYGPTAAYGSAIAGDLGSDNELHVVGGAIAGLTPGTTYHFRVTATNAVGAAATADQTFTTGSPPVVTSPAPRCKRGFVRRKGKCVKRRP